MDSAVCKHILFLCFVVAQCSSQSFPILQKLHPTGLENGANFGTSLAISSKFIASGAHNNRNETGSVFVYAQRGAAPDPFYLIKELSPSYVSQGANFGCAIVAHEGLLVVGAQYDSANLGSVYVFEVVADTVTLVQTIANPTRYLSSPSLFFGSSLSLSADGVYLSVGAPSGSGRGGVFTFTIDDSASTFKSLNLLVPELPVGINFGQSVAVARSLSGENVLAVGANHDNNLTGSVYIFVNFEVVHKLEPHNEPIEPNSPYFGSVVSMSISVGHNTFLLAASAPFSGPGATYLYSISLDAAGQAGARATVSYWTSLSPHSPRPFDSGYGISCAFAGEGLLAIGGWMVGASGSVYVYSLPPVLVESELPVPTLKAVLQPPLSKRSFFGSAVSLSQNASSLKNGGTSVAPFLLVGADGDLGDEGSVYIFKL